MSHAAAIGDREASSQPEHGKPFAARGEGEAVVQGDEREQLGVVVARCARGGELEGVRGAEIVYADEPAGVISKPLCASPDPSSTLMRVTA